MAIVYRLATSDDVPQLQALIVESVRGLSTGLYTPRQIESALKHIFGVDSRLIADETYYVAVDDAPDGSGAGQVVGCGGWSKRRTLFGGDQMKSAEDNLLDPARDPARIRAFFVHPAWARQGIGRHIIEMCEEAARSQGFHAMELASTLPGEPLYEAMGYAVTRRFEAPMPDGESLPVVRMAKTLS